MIEIAGNDSTVLSPGSPTRSFTRRTFPAIMLLLFVMSALAIAVLLNITGAQDRRAREQSLFSPSGPSRGSAKVSDGT